MKALKIGCLSCLLIIGILIVIYLVASFSLMSSSSSPSKQTPFEVRTKKGLVKLHLGIPKDSVLFLIGEPDDYQSHSIGNTIIEEIGYKVNNERYEDLNFTFEDGKLVSFSQY